LFVSFCFGGWFGRFLFVCCLSHAAGKLMMLPTDLVLKTDPEFLKWTTAYAKDQNLFFKDFSAAFSKLIHLGMMVNDLFLNIVHLFLLLFWLTFYLFILTRRNWPDARCVVCQSRAGQEGRGDARGCHARQRRRRQVPGYAWLSLSLSLLSLFIFVSFRLIVFICIVLYCIICIVLFVCLLVS
jgi:hypothetical protein